MRNILLILCVFQLSVANAQQKENELKNILKQISVTNVYELSNTIGFAGTPSHQLILLDSLLDNSSIEFLLNNALHHKNAVVRLYCYKALLIKNVIIPPILSNQFCKDHTEVSAISNCIMETTTVKDFYKKHFSPST